MWSYFRRFFRNYFYYTKKERRGFIILIIINLSIAYAIAFSSDKQSDSFDYKNFEKQIDEFYASLQKKRDFDNLSRLDKYIIARYDTLKLFEFDPNTATDEDFIKLGLTDKQIKNIRSYQASGGHFYKKEDLKKIYGIRPRQYFFLEPYIKINKQKSSKNTVSGQPFFFDPNTVSYNDLIALGFSKYDARNFIYSRTKGWKFYTKKDFQKNYYVKPEIYKKLENYIQIDRAKLIPEINSAGYYELLPFVKNKNLTSRILKYRDKLGGFFDKEQLNEVYGLTEQLFKTIKDSIKIDTLKIKKININTASSEQLASHPYISRQNAEKIINSREKLPFTNIKDLENRNILTRELLKKLKHYLLF